MLSKEDTDLLCRVGPETPMGELMRRYWIPAIYDWELEPDDQPQRIRLLGEDLLAWRDSDGKPAVTQEHCAHRGVSLYYGRNEESGLRCAYHGWKYDANGALRRHAERAGFIGLPQQGDDPQLQNRRGWWAGLGLHGA